MRNLKKQDLLKLFYYSEMHDLNKITLRAQQRQQDFDDTAEWLAVTGAICILLLVWVFL